MDLDSYQHYHFIGIGGISMSGLAEMLVSRGKEVSGSDRQDSPMLTKLRAEGITCFVGHLSSQVHGADAVVYTAAIPKDNCEMQEALRLNIPLIYRGDLLGAWMARYGTALGICGTHGKSTTTSMIATILLECGADPSVHIGTELDLISGTTRSGKSDLFVTEACEYQDSFLDLFPTCVVVLNIEADHLDYFSGLDAIRDSFTRFMRLCPEETGLIIYNGDDPECQRAAEAAGRPSETFGLSESATWRAADVSLENGHYAFTVLYKGQPRAHLRLGVPGRHNIYNALAALAAALRCGIEPEAAAPALTHYTGAARRFAFEGFFRGAEVIHDYAHHPTEIRATLSAARDKARGDIWCIFQPHTYTRTKALFDDFIGCFQDASHLLLVDIYAAREPDPGDISSPMLAQALRGSGHPDARYAPNFRAAVQAVQEGIRPGDLILVLGAGDITGILPLLKE